MRFNCSTTASSRGLGDGGRLPLVGATTNDASKISNHLPAPAAARAAAEKTLARRPPRKISKQTTRASVEAQRVTNDGRVTRRSRWTRRIVKRDGAHTTAHRTPVPSTRHFPERLRLLDGVDPLRPERPPVRRSHSEERTSSPARHSFGAFVRRSAIHTKRTSSIKVMRENANDATRSPRRARGPSPKKQTALDVCG